MSTLLIIRLHPAEPVTGDEFTNYLKGLSIAAHELSFDDPGGSTPAFGTAGYFAPKLPASPSKNPAPVPDPKSRITQHFEIIPGATPKNLATRNFFAVATAVVEIPDAPKGREYRTVDVRLVITRDGSEIVQKKYYNVPVAAGPIPKNPNDFPKLQPIALYLPLRALGHQLPTTGAEPGAAPDFASLRTAMEQVLIAEQGNTQDIANLTREQCRHIAFEITWDPIAYPLPVPNRPLEAIYTGPQSADSDDERERRLFESKVLAHYATHNNEAAHLTNFIFAVSAAIWCQQKTQKASQAGFSFPIFPQAPAREAKVILEGAETALGFEVPAEYFYAITAILPARVRREER